MNLARQYDAALFDLDGVIYLGPDAIPGVPGALRELRGQGVRVGFVTNNAARTPETVARHLTQLGIEAESSDVVNSTMATLRMLSDELPAGARVLAIGTEALAQQLSSTGLTVVDGLEDEPVAVVQGYDPHIEWARLELTAFAIQRGAAWYVTNTDLTRPSERGIVPGCGAQVAVVQACVRLRPRVAGKPYPPLLEETVDRLEAEHPLFVGDRLDTDILGANNVDMDSLFVFSGAHTKHELLTADADHRPTYLALDVSGLLEEPRTAQREGAAVLCRAQRARVQEGIAVLDTEPATRSEQLDALWALLQLAWQDGADATAAVEALELVP